MNTHYFLLLSNQNLYSSTQQLVIWIKKYNIDKVLDLFCTIMGSFQLSW